MTVTFPADKPERTIIGSIWQAESHAASAGLYLRLGDRAAAIEALRRAEDAARGARLRLIVKAPGADAELSPLEERAMDGDR